MTQVRKHRRRSSGTVSQAASLQRRCCFRILSKIDLKVVQKLCKSRPKVIQKSSKRYPKVVQNQFKSRPKVVQKLFESCPPPCLRYTLRLSSRALEIDITFYSFSHSGVGNALNLFAGLGEVQEGAVR